MAVRQCGSVRGCMGQCARHCAAVYGSVWQCAQQCGTMPTLDACSCAAVCVGVLGSVWQCARAVVCVCLAVRQCSCDPIIGRTYQNINTTLLGCIYVESFSNEFENMRSLLILCGYQKFANDDNQNIISKADRVIIQCNLMTTSHEYKM